MGMMLEQLNARRARILQAARQMIADHGYDGVTMRHLAERCGVSVPTLYNQFGGKDQLLAAAINDYFRTEHDPAVRDSSSGLPRILALLEQNAQRLLADAAYHRNLMGAFGSLESTAGVQQAIAERFVQIFAEELAYMQRRRQLQDWASPAQLAAQMTSACIGSSIQWGSGSVSNDDLTAHMRYAAGLVMLGLCKGNARTQLEQIIKADQCQLTGGPEHGTAISATS